MPVFNALPFLDEAIASILQQTHRDFRFAIYDDHSTDGSYERALDWAQKDGRIIVIRSGSRLGPSASSNAAAALAQTEFVARMDADDIAAPERLALQLDALRSHPGAVLVGSTHEMIDGKGALIWSARPGRIAGSAPPFVHPSIMYRRSAFDAAGGYRVETDYFEDADLFRRMAALGALLVVNRPLIRLRFAGQHARLRDDPEVVLQRIGGLYRSPEETAPGGGRISPMAFYSVAVLAIMTLNRPRLLDLMIRRASFAKLPLALAVLGIIAIAEVSPRSARLLMRIISSVRDRLHRSNFSSDGVYIWDRSGAKMARTSKPLTAVQPAPIDQHAA